MVYLVQETGEDDHEACGAQEREGLPRQQGIHNTRGCQCRGWQAPQGREKEGHLGAGATPVFTATTPLQRMQCAGKSAKLTCH